MNILNMKSSCDKFHLGTVAIVEKLVGIPENNIDIFPIVAKKEGELIFYIPGKYGAVDEGYIHSYILNGAFSLEVLMKYLHVKESGSAPRKHNLFELYDSMSDDTKNCISGDIRIKVNNSSLHDETISYFKTEHSIDVQWNPEFLLKKSDLAFERWRYIFEGNLDPTWFIGYKEIRDALLTRLCKLS